jgi:hypothetical protein
MSNIGSTEVALALLVLSLTIVLALVTFVIHSKKK